ncbi:MAG TPA: hypothetical protein VIV61_02810 [Candidatus Ozemobacteraceae bacterium]
MALLSAGSSAALACNSFSHQWSLTGLEEGGDRLPVLAARLLLERLPERLASASAGFPWFQNASSVILLGIDAATDTFRADLADLVSRAYSREITASESIPGLVVIPRLESLTSASDPYELLQKRAGETGRCAIAVQVVAGYRSLSHFVDLLPIRLGTIRTQIFERAEVLVRMAGPGGEIGLIGPLKAEVTLSVDTRLYQGAAYVGRIEWRPDQDAATLADLSTLAAALETASKTASSGTTLR